MSGRPGDATGEPIEPYEAPSHRPSRASAAQLRLLVICIVVAMASACGPDAGDARNTPGDPPSEEAEDQALPGKTDHQDWTGTLVQGVHTFHTVAPGIVVAVPRYGGGNSTVVVGAEGVLVVDPQGSEAAGRALIEEIRRLTPLPVRFVINTHWHGDHHGGNSAFVQAFPEVQVIAHPATARDIRAHADGELREIAPFLRDNAERALADLERGERDGQTLDSGQRAQLRAYARAELEGLEGVTDETRYPLPTRLATTLTLEDPAHRIEVLHPGRAHTDGDLWVHLPDHGVLIAGDLLTVPYVVVRSGYPLAKARVLESIGSLQPTIIVPGHGLPGAHTELLQTMVDFLRDVSQTTRDLRDQGRERSVVLDEVLASPGIRAYEERIIWDEPGGMTFLDFETLVRMTTARALLELGAEGDRSG